jgi:hypothetical protein
MGVVHHKQHSKNYIRLRDIYRKALQIQVNSVESFHVHGQIDGDQKDNQHFCIFVISI